MIEEETVFILGAGASCPYGYPSGRELRQEICSSFVSDSSAYFRAQGATHPEIHIALNKAETFVKKFHNSSTQSIDLFLARNPEFMVMGKWAIIFRIFAAEKKSKFREQMEHKNLDWYSYLFERLTDDLVKKEDYTRFGDDNKVSFISFNYDRSLEHFLYVSLLNSFSNIPVGEIKEQLNKHRIIHIFGQVAGLDWQELDNKIEYGRDDIDIQRLADKLRIIYEKNENPVFEEAHELIRKAKRIFFLGFGYAKENLEILKIPEIIRDEQKIYGTALNFTKKEINSIQYTFPHRLLLSSYVHIKNMDSLGLLRKYL